MFDPTCRVKLKENKRHAAADEFTVQEALLVLMQIVRPQTPTPATIAVPYR